MTSAERVRRTRARQRAAKIKRATARMNAIARPVIATVMAGGDLDAVPPDTQQGCIATADAILEGLHTAGLSIVRTKSLK